MPKNHDSSTALRDLAPVIAKMMENEQDRKHGCQHHNFRIASIFEEDDESRENQTLTSDDSYYDECEPAVVATLNNSLLAEGRKTAVTQLGTLSEDHMLLQDYRTMSAFTEAANVLGKDRLTELEWAYGSCFLTSISALKHQLTDLNKSQMKQVCENVKLQVHDRGSVLFEHGQPRYYAYIVLVGAVLNCRELLTTNNLSLLATGDNVPIRELLGDLKVRDRVNLERRNGVRFQKTIDPVDNYTLTLLEMSQSQLSTLLYYTTEDSLSFLQECIPLKQGEFKPGDCIGKLEKMGEEEPNEHDFTAVCKTDCLLLRIDQQIFSLLHHQKLQKQKDQLADFLCCKFPIFHDFYSIIRLKEVAFQIFKEVKYAANQKVIIENQADGTVFLIKHGQIQLKKRLFAEDPFDAKS